MHIGKCGGTTIGWWLYSVKRQFVGTTASGYHEHHMNRRYAEPDESGTSNFLVWVRDPVARFRSAYDWQLSVINAPVPAHANPGWTCSLGPDCPSPGKVATKAHTGHAYTVSFEEQMLHFDSANHLAESIYAMGNDGKVARALMANPLEHIAKGIGWYLFDGAFVRKHHKRIFVGSIEHMDEDMARLSELLGLEEEAGPDGPLRTTAHDTRISERGRHNLQRWYNHTDYTLRCASSSDTACSIQHRCTTSMHGSGCGPGWGRVGVWGGGGSWVSCAHWVSKKSSHVAAARALSSLTSV